ncbi:LOW QUALITY PROTEIN: hypothetical protein MAR_034180 [Mya arenaria]|uniref:Uncharacterized protein n=1 Tax=Mya arenaria TaxID=6604 RepID=A0ABY7GB75_MYAAR|nr:LOW QUALITY PROTEIN: hypothetical protein MAR_034180 [Mya arenaria]
MKEEAERQTIPENWSLIFDEMFIHSDNDIQISKEGDVIELVGFTVNGVEGDHCHTIRTGTSDKQLGTHILQLLFLGITGFRFPIAYFSLRESRHQNFLGGGMDIWAQNPLYVHGWGNFKQIVYAFMCRNQ